MKIAINGFGRIGRNFLRNVLQDKNAVQKLNVVVINIGPAPVDQMAHLFKYDTLLGTYPGKVTYKNHVLYIDEYAIRLIAELDPKACKWGSYDIDWVVDASGAFTSADKAQKHLDAGAQHVLITAPAKGDVVTIIPGINMHEYNAQKDYIVSLGSCTTNAFLPMLKVLDDVFGISQGFMTTIHSYTNSQVLLDKEDGDLRRSRAAALNIIPTTTGANRLVDQLLPSLKGKMQARAIRVPVAKVSLIDLVVRLQKAVTQENIHDAFKHASQSDLKNIVTYTDEPLVSSDYSGNPASVIIDGELTKVQNDMIQIFGWYDNEWGYSVRLKDFLLYVDNNR